jgi:transglutaminase-like putative cysteine protease
LALHRHHAGGREDYGGHVTLLAVRHTTHYRYSRPVRFGDHRMLVRPRDTMEQRLEQFSLHISPEPVAIRWILDVFGNGIAIASFEEAAETLSIEARMVLDHTHSRTPLFEIDGRAKTYPFQYSDADLPDLAATIRRQFPQDTQVDEWARQFVHPDEPTDTAHLLMTMTTGIREGFKYLRRPDPGTQHPSFTLAHRQGTCRDFALLMVEGARSLGLAARFVTGYLYSPTRDGNYRGGGATHAWAQVYLPGAGWVEFDPTNGIVGARDLIRVGVAREPRQAIPISGTFVGAREDYLGMEVEVEVNRVTDVQDGMG